MPVYEYQCDACGKTFEARQRMSDPPLESCSCGEHGTVRRLIGAGNGLIFKGSGFYITDYRNGGGSGNGNGKSSDSSPAKTEAPAAAKPAGGHSCGSGCGCGA